MKKNVSKSSREIGSRIAVPVLFAVLCLLTYLTISAISGSSRTADGFDLEDLTNEARQTDTDVSDYLLPEFIGVTVKGVRSGIAGSVNIVSELYSLLTPTLRSAFFYTVPLEEGNWEDGISAENSVYIKYHSELPDGILALFAGMETNSGSDTIAFRGNVREIFILPPESVSEDTVMMTRSDSGELRMYVIPGHKASVGTGELERFVRSYSSSMTSFIFNEGKYENLSISEPIFTGELSARELIMTDGTSVLIQNSSEEREEILRVFGLNPDKLLNVHSEADGSAGYYDTRGIVNFRRSTFEYLRSSEDNGRSVSDILGRAFSPSRSAAEVLTDYIHAAILLYESIAAVNPVYIGGEADLMLRSVSSENGEVTLRFLYTVNNLRISDVQDAFRITFSAGRVTSAVLYTMTVRILAERSFPYSEWWYASTLDDFSSDVRLVYRSDFVSDTVSAEWAAEKLIFAETEAEYGK
ncbi:MAG: hypothetical protein IKU40_05850 [Clostridia bacterium]|nr:hypothetical protein [Clostridia bacterium]